jgi:chromatin modification-related protein EAF6
MELAHIEKQIYDLETTYLEDTQNFGNIFVGWNKYFSANEKSRKRRAVSNHERLFSLSSASSPAALKEDGRQVNVALSSNIESISQHSAVASKRGRKA